MQTDEFDRVTAPLMSDDQVDALMDEQHLSMWNAPSQGDAAGRRDSRRECLEVDAAANSQPPRG